MAISIQQVTRATSIFFARHWNFKTTPPKWSESPYDGTGHLGGCEKKPGCYALVKGKRSKIVYVGSGISRGNKRYKDYGLWSRLLHYLIRNEDRAAEQRWKFRTTDYTGLYWIGFPRDRAYLAIALEHFLIARFPELQNKNRVAYGKAR